MGSLSGIRFPLIVGIGIFVLHLLLFRRWPPDLADVIGSALLALAIGLGLLLALRLLGKRNAP